MKLRTAAMATALVAATLPALPTSAHAFGWHHGGWGGWHHGGGWGWGGVGVGLATGALIGAALATPYYDDAYAYDYGYPGYAPAYGYDDGYAPAYAYDYGYAPSYGYTSYAYTPSYSVTYAAPSLGYRHYAYHRGGYRHYANTYPARTSVRTAYASYRPGYARAAHTTTVSMSRGHVRHH